MARIGLLGSYGGLNVGDEAICTGILQSLRKHRPGDELVLLSRNPDHTRAHHDASEVVAARDVSRDDLLPVLESLDALLLGGGGVLYDGEAQTYTRVLALASDVGVPTAAFAVGAGPLDQSEDRRAVAEACDRMACITVRDQTSKRALEAAGTSGRIIVTADPGLLVGPQAPLDPNGDHHDRGVVVGFSVREAGKAAPDLDADRYHELLANAADFLVHRHGARILFVPTERGDIVHAHAVMAAMTDPEHAGVTTGTLEPAALAALVATFDFAVGMRLHFLIFAALASVPFLPLPYAAKVSDFVRSVGMPLPASAKREHAGTLLAAIDRAWDDRVRLAAQLHETVPPVRRNAATTAGIVLDALGLPSRASHLVRD